MLCLVLSPESIPWAIPDKRTLLDSLLFCIPPLLWMWDALVRRNYISSYNGPLTPVLDNLSITIGVGRSTLFHWKLSLPSPIITALDQQGLKSLAKLQSISPLSGSSWLLYFQLRDFYITLNKQGKVHADLTNLEALCLQDSKLTHVIAKLYSLLLSLKCADDPPLNLDKWERHFLLSL